MGLGDVRAGGSCCCCCAALLKHFDCHKDILTFCKLHHTHKQHVASLQASITCPGMSSLLVDPTWCGAESGILYICGVPGTGKTACVLEVLSAARSKAQKAGAQFVSINCLQLPSPPHVYSRLWEKLSGQTLGPARWVTCTLCTCARHPGGGEWCTGKSISSIQLAV